MQLWEEVLDIRPIGVRHDFFELGGHSLLAARLAARVQRLLGLRLNVLTLFQHPTIEQLATVLRRERTPRGLLAHWCACKPVNPTCGRCSSSMAAAAACWATRSWSASSGPPGPSTA